MPERIQAIDKGKIMKRKKIIMCLTAAALMLSACSNDNKSSTQSKHTSSTAVVVKNNSILTVGVGAAIPTLDPGVINDATAWRVNNDLFEGLVTLTQDDRIVPALASSWEISKDGTVYTFHLRENAKWSNGNPVTAGDFVYAFRRNLDPNTPNLYASFYKVIKGASAIIDNESKDFNQLGVKAVDDHTLQITLNHPVSYFLDLMLIPASEPLYPPAVKANPTGWANVGSIVSNGPYELKEWVPNGHLSVVKNPYYWNAPKVAIEEVKFLPIVNPSSEYDLYKTGGMDFTWTVPSGQSDQYYKDKFGKNFHTNSYIGNEYFWFNFKDPNFAKWQVRKALTMVVDRKAIVDNITRMGESPSYSVLPDGAEGGIYADIYKKAMPEYAWVNESMAKRNSQAKALLESAGYSSQHPLRFTVLYDTHPLKRQIVLAVISMWQQAFGDLIKVDIENQEWKVFLQSMNTHQFQMGLLDWKADYNDASDWVELITCGSSNNLGLSCNKTVTDNFNKAISTADKSQSQAYMQQAIVAAMNDYIILPLYNLSYNHLVSDRVAGYDSQNNHINQQYSKWFSLT
ncbi:MAG: peptide ABC transporter substrate-binding protein [Francisellaceae bacterium]